MVLHLVPEETASLLWVQTSEARRGDRLFVLHKHLQLRTSELPMRLASTD